MVISTTHFSTFSSYTAGLFDMYLPHLTIGNTIPFIPSHLSLRALQPNCLYWSTRKDDWVMVSCREWVCYLLLFTNTPWEFPHALFCIFPKNQMSLHYLIVWVTLVSTCLTPQPYCWIIACVLRFKNMNIFSLLNPSSNWATLQFLCEMHGQNYMMKSKNIDPSNTNSYIQTYSWVLS